MKNILVLLILLFATGYAGAQSLSGTVTDSASGQTIPGVAVYFPQLKLSSTTDAKGNYKISPLPNGTYTVEAEILGYATIYKQITINGDATLNFVMALSSSSGKEVVITALGNITTTQRAPVPVTMVTHMALIEQWLME